MFRQFLKDDRGQGLGEYALIAALVSIGLMTVMVVFRNSMGSIFSHVAEVLNGAEADQYAG